MAQRSSLAPCQPDWEPTFGASAPLDGYVTRIFEYDDGSGPALFVGGNFTHAGALHLGGVGKWQGGHWTSIASGPLNADVWDFAAFDDGTGMQLYACGLFTSIGGVAANNIAKWNGVSWSPLGAGANGHVRAVEVYDDGSGPALYAAGNFTSAGGFAVSRAAKWDGAVWSAIGASFNNAVFDLQVYDDGSGPLLYAGGLFSTAGPAATQLVAAWNGSTWSSLSGAASSGIGIVELHVFDEGLGPALYASGRFTSLGGVAVSNVGRWNGSAWSAMGVGIPPEGVSMAQIDVGSGAHIFVGQAFTGATSPTYSRVARLSVAVVGIGLDVRRFCLVAGCERDECAASIGAAASFEVTGALWADGRL